MRLFDLAEGSRGFDTDGTEQGQERCERGKDGDRAHRREQRQRIVGCDAVEHGPQQRTGEERGPEAKGDSTSGSKNKRPGNKSYEAAARTLISYRILNIWIGHRRDDVGRRVLWAGRGRRRK